MSKSTSTFFDANTWLGRWPFTFQDAHTPRTLVAHLRAHGIARALVSPIDAVFAPEPSPANTALLRDTRAAAEFTPVPVINPALINWREQLASVAADPRVRAIRLLPNYHGYRLQTRALDALVAETAQLNLRVIVTARLIDERHEHHALNLKAVPLATIDAFLARHANAKSPILVSGLLYSEINKLVPKYPHMLADLSFAEWHETIDALLENHDARRFVFASHTPFLITAAATAKFETIRTPAKKIAGIASRNLEAFLV